MSDNNSLARRVGGLTLVLGAVAVKAFGTPAAYNNWIFATGIPDSIELKLLYAGVGTLWTDIPDAVRINVPPPVKKN